MAVGKGLKGKLFLFALNTLALILIALAYFRTLWAFILLPLLITLSIIKPQLTIPILILLVPFSLGVKSIQVMIALLIIHALLALEVYKARHSLTPISTCLLLASPNFSSILPPVAVIPLFSFSKDITGGISCLILSLIALSLYINVNIIGDSLLMPIHVTQKVPLSNYGYHSLPLYDKLSPLYDPIAGLIQLLLRNPGVLLAIACYTILIVLGYIVYSRRYTLTNAILSSALVEILAFTSNIALLTLMNIVLKVSFIDLVVSSILCTGVSTMLSVTFHFASNVLARVKYGDKGKELELYFEYKNTKYPTLNDVGDMEDIKEELYMSIILPLRRDISKHYGIKPAKGILLFGPPGCGKTFIMKAIANTFKFKFYYLKLDEILSKWYGESERRVAQIFELARRNAPAIIFIDEIDSIAKRRDLYVSDDVAPRMLSIILSYLDGLNPLEGVIVVAATNRPDLLDPALLRPGRFDKLIYVPLPDEKARTEIFKVHLRGKPLAEDVDPQFLAAITEGYTAADIKELVDEVCRKVALEAYRTGIKRKITLNDFLEVLRVMKPSVTKEDIEKYERCRKRFERRLFRRVGIPKYERQIKVRRMMSLRR